MKRSYYEYLELTAPPLATAAESIKYHQLTRKKTDAYANPEVNIAGQNIAER